MGSANTDAIIARMNAGSVASSDYAAGAARGYTGGGYTDWFLPSKDELNAMYLYKASIPPELTAAYGFASGDYWSSSQFNANSAWIQWFGVGGDQFNGNKNATSQRVRPIRAF
jgi:hypothetical protein